VVTVVNLHSIALAFNARTTSNSSDNHSNGKQSLRESLLELFPEDTRETLGSYRSVIIDYVKGVGQSTLALSFNLTGLIAGYILASSYGVLNNYQWPLIMFPGLLSVRGAIGGLYAGRLSTALHLGTIKAQYRGNTSEMYHLNSAIITLTYMSALFLGVIVNLTSIFLFGFSPLRVLNIFLVVFTVMALSLLIISPTTLFISIQAFLKGLDPDMVVYPIISTVADIVVSITFTRILVFLFVNEGSTLLVMSVFSLLFSAIAIRQYLVERDQKEYMETIHEFIITLICVSIIVNYTGNVLKSISQRIGSTPDIYAVYPAIIDTVGDVGSIIGSTATTKLSLGLIGSSFSDIKGHFREISYGWIGSLIMFSLYSVVSSAIFGSTDFGKLISTTLLTNLIVIPIIALISFAVGIITFKRGLNPDNFIIPIETSLADSITTYVLYSVIRLIYKI
jgi:mgtE-like transporter